MGAAATMVFHSSGVKSDLLAVELVSYFLVMINRVAALRKSKQSRFTTVEFLFQSLHEPYAGKSRRRCPTARKLAQHGLHGRWQARVEPCGIILIDRFSNSAI